MKIKSTQPHEAIMNYTDIVVHGDRSVTNRTPNLDSYQDPARNGQQTGYNSHQINQSTSVPRPTIASELKMLREARGSPPGVDMLGSYQSQAVNHGTTSN